MATLPVSRDGVIPGPMRRALLMACLSSSCSVGSDVPPSPASPAGELAADAGAVATKAREVESLALELESRTDQLRRDVAAGTTTQAEAVAELRDIVTRLDTANAELQGMVASIETEARARTGMAAPEPPEKRRR